MDEAALMLESGNEAIARIATRVGYETTTAFSKAFKQHYNFSPGRYLLRLESGHCGGLKGSQVRKPIYVLIWPAIGRSARSSLDRRQ
jgi:AraC-like DNA-binding protein